MSNSNDVDTNAKLEVSASAVELVLIPRESSFYFSSIRDFAALKDQIEGAAYTEADIFGGFTTDVNIFTFSSSSRSC